MAWRVARILVRDFIIEAAKTYGDAVVSNEPKTQEIVNLYAMVSRMRVLSMPRSAACADRVMRRILDTYFQPNRTGPRFASGGTPLDVSN